MIRLPNWALTKGQPAIYDSESSTVIEMTGKLYAKMQALIDEYNTFATECNAAIEKLEADITGDHEAHKNEIERMVVLYLEMLDHKVSEAHAYMKNNLEGTASKLLADISDNLADRISEFEDMQSTYNTRFAEMTNKVDNTIASQNAVINANSNQLNTGLTSMNSRLSEQDAKIQEQDAKVEEAVSHMMTNLEGYIAEAVEAKIASGEITVGVGVDSDENMIIAAREIGGVATDLYMGYDAASETVTINEVTG